MSLQAERITAVLFDYGNTIIQFARPQIEACDRALARALERLFGPVDRARLKEIRDADRLAPYGNGLHERNLNEMTTRLVQGLFGVLPTTDQAAGLIRARYDAVVEAITVPPGASDLLARIHARYRTGLVSNYPDGAAIRESLRKTGLAVHFDAVVISADVGRVKPHPLPFENCLAQLQVKPEQAVYVGDNWLADVQGAKRLGMQMIRTLQFEAPERFDPQADDLHPDATIDQFSGLADLLL